MIPKFIGGKTEFKSLAERLMREMGLSKEDLQSIANMKQSPFLKVLESYLTFKHNNAANTLIDFFDEKQKERVYIQIAELKGRNKTVEDIFNLPKVAEKILKESIKSKKTIK